MSPEPLQLRANGVVLATPTKQCAGPCAQRLPWTDFYAKVKWPDGTMRQPHSRCRHCFETAPAHVASKRRYDQRRHAARRADPEAWAEYLRQQSKRYQANRTDPEWWAARRAQIREAKRARNGVAPDRCRRIRAGQPPEVAERVDAGPFREWLDAMVLVYGSVRAVAVACGVAESRVTKVRSGSIPRVELASVDAALQREGSTMLDELYPIGREAA